MTVEAQASAMFPADYGPQNPFWPVGVIPAGGEESGPAGPTNQVDIVQVTFPSPGIVTVQVATSPPLSAWTIDWGDGSAVVPVPPPGQAVTRGTPYADISSGKTYTITVVSGTDTDKRQIQY